jgi:hypothetical protein
LARSKPREKKSRKLYYAIPIVAVLIVAAGFVVAYVLPPPSDVLMSFNTYVEIQEAVNSTASRLVAPAGVGVRCDTCTWMVHTFDLYGVGGNYPVYTDPTPTGSGSFFALHVKSRVVQNYTLGDFFDVWGQPLGASNTIGRIADGTNTIWQMCVGVYGAPPSQLGNWRSEVLQANKEIVLIFYYNGGPQTGCL